MKAALYLRVSSVDQAEEGYSLPAQEKKLREFCADHDYEVASVYADAGISGKDMVHRPAILRLLDDAKNKTFDTVLIWKLTRFARSLKDLSSACALLDKKGITFMSITEAFDSSTPSGRLMRNMLGSIAEFEREVISENVKLALAEKAAQGWRTCSCVLGYDTVPDTLRVNDAEATIVRFIYADYLEYRSLSEVSRHCADKRYRGKKGCRISPESVKVILTRPVYVGYYTFNGRLHKPAIPYTPIIDLNTYESVQYALGKSANHIKEVI